MGFSWRTHLLQFTCNKNLTNLMWKTWTCELGLSRNFPMTYKRNYIRLNYKIFYANICFLNESVTLMINPAISKSQSHKTQNYFIQYGVLHLLDLWNFMYLWISVLVKNNKLCCICIIHPIFLDIESYVKLCLLCMWKIR